MAEGLKGEIQQQTSHAAKQTSVAFNAQIAGLASTLDGIKTDLAKNFQLVIDSPAKTPEFKIDFGDNFD